MREFVRAAQIHFHIEVWLSLVERYVRDVEAASSNLVTSTVKKDIHRMSFRLKTKYPEADASGYFVFSLRAVLNSPFFISSNSFAVHCSSCLLYHKKIRNADVRLSARSLQQQRQLQRS